MKSNWFLAGAFLMAPPAMANVTSEHHRLCSQAKDYAGCIRAMKGDLDKPQVKYIDQTNRPGLLAEMGNACPAGYAYSGAGQCRQVVCKVMGIFGKNEPQLANRGHSCKDKNRELGVGGRGSLRWGDQYRNAANDPKCPKMEPGHGDVNSCVTALRTKKSITTGVWAYDVIGKKRLDTVKGCFGSCEESGIQVGDEIVSVNGIPHGQGDNATPSEGEEIVYVVKRGNRELTFTTRASLQNHPFLPSLNSMLDRGQETSKKPKENRSWERND